MFSDYGPINDYDVNCLFFNGTTFIPSSNHSLKTLLQHINNKEMHLLKTYQYSLSDYERKNKYEKRGWKIIDNTYDKINMGFFEIQRLYSSKEFQCISINNTINQLDDDIKTETVDENIQKIDKYI